MYIVMHCGGMPFNGETIKNESLGGSETAAYYLAKELAKNHRVTMFTNHKQEGEWDGVQYRWAGNITEQMPMGERYHIYAVATPHDVNIAQRSPIAYLIPVASKINCWWLHDVPLPDMKNMVQANVAATDLIFAVSEWQKRQIVDAWGLKEENIVIIGNGIDLSLFDGIADTVSMESGFNMIYSSRPERGLETLVKPGGIMDRLQKELPEAHLYVCAYDNVTAPMAQYYAWLNSRCNELSNVTLLGSLTKQDLADVMRQCDLLAYPTIFDETSCITAMEAMAAGLPMLSSYAGALPETVDGSGSILLPLIPADGPRPGSMEAGNHDLMVDENMFIDAIKQIAAFSDEDCNNLKEAQKAAAKGKSWELVSMRANEAISEKLEELSSSNPAVLRHLIRMSDIYAIKNGDFYTTDEISIASLEEENECYSFTNESDWSNHYAKYYEYEKDRGVNYGPEALDGNDRFEYVASIIGRLPAGSSVLDYGCAHGHYTINLAKRFPSIIFVGVDITKSNIEKATDWAKRDSVKNARFVHGQVIGGEIQYSEGEALALNSFDAVIAAEVLEHVARPQGYVEALSRHLKDSGKFIITTPYGPWEAIGYEQHWPWRAHVHHFERADLHDMFGKFDGFAITVISSGRTKEGDPIGSFVCQFGKPSGKCGEIDYKRKLSQMAPRQTLSVCMIVKDAEGTIHNAIKSVAGVADEFVIAIDEKTADETLSVLHDALHKFCPHKPKTIFVGKSPTEIGFDEARNSTIDKASGDWILWMDADEVLEGAGNLYKYLRHNFYDGYGTPHHHFAIEPAGLLKTDYPCRIFRNHKGIRFYGVVHEHPESGLNEGVKHMLIIPDVVVAHYGYTNEDVRRGRFNRNLPLLVRDREKYPERTLGKFLWLRDLYQQTRYELERAPMITPDMIERGAEAIEVWEDLVRNAPLRLAVESLEWYGGMVQILGKGKKYTFAVGSEHGESTAGGVFYNDTHAQLLLKRMFDEAA